MEDIIVAIQASKEGPTSKGYFSTCPSQDNTNKGMQPSLHVDREGELGAITPPHVS